MDLTFHHLGVACRDLDAEARVYSCVGYTPEGPDFVDTKQGIQGRFLVGPGPRIELLVGLPGSDVLQPWLEKGIKIYHQAFLVDELRAAIKELCTDGGRVMVHPVPAVAFEGREIAFVMLRNLALVELVQT